MAEKYSYKKENYSAPITLTNVDVWTARGTLENQDVVIERGVVKSIQNSKTKSSGPRQVLMPAGVDSQVHLRVPGQAQKETAESGLRASMHGGVGALLTMPNTRPVIDSVEVLAQARQEVAPFEKEFGVATLFSAAVTKSQQGKEVVDFRKLADAGIAAFTDDGLGVEDDSLMDKAFAALEKMDVPLLQHAEMKGAKGPLAPGPVQKKLGLEPYLDSIEVDMIARDLRVLKKYPKARYHVLHLSAGRSVDVIDEARRAGLRVSCEVSPHHLLFSSDDIEEDNKSYKMNPPLRSPSDRTKLRAALKDGRIDWAATDHAPHEPESKTKDFPIATFGTIGVETFLQTLLTMWAKGELSAERLVEVWSLKPAQFLGIEDEYGDIQVGKPLRAILVDVGAEYTVQPTDFWGQSKNSCFVGHKLRGRIHSHYTRAGVFHFE